MKSGAERRDTPFLHVTRESFVEKCESRLRNGLVDASEPTGSSELRAVNVFLTRMCIVLTAQQ
jgi:hypothetical protein